jgi:hypothetical protein
VIDDDFDHCGADRCLMALPIFVKVYL